MRPLSYSQIALYQSCPLNYKLQYIEGLKPKDRWYLSFGSSLHQCAEFFFKVKTPPPPSLERLLGHYEKNWISDGYESPEEEAGYKEYGRQILSRFWGLHSADFRMPVAVEHQFNIDIDGVKLRGFIDRVDKLDSGGLSIVDYKSNQQLFTRDYLAKDLQLTLYQVAVEQMWFLPVEMLTLYHLRSNTPCSIGAREKGQLEEARWLVLEVAEGITAGRFPAIENQYCPCDFPEHCPYFRHLHLKPVEDEETPPGLSGESVKEAVEEYTTIQGQIKELELKLKELKQAIVEYCQAERLNRVYGIEHAITYKMVERSGFDEAEVRALLESEGLWQRVLGLDRSRLEELLEDETVPADIRRRVSDLKKAVSGAPCLWVRRLSE